MEQANQLFDRSFDIPQEDEQEAKYKEDDLIEARRAAFEEGRQSGIAEMKQNNEGEFLDLSRKLIAGVTALSEQDAKRRDEISTDCGQLLHQICLRLVPRLARQNSLSEIVGIVEECLVTQSSEPRIVVRVAQELSEDLKQKLTQLSTQSGYGGELILIPDESLPKSDCSVLWADGGAERRLEQIWSQIETSLHRTLAGQEDDAERTTTNQPVTP